MRRHAGLYRALLALYPRSFRQEYEPDLVQAFTDLYRDRGLVSTWARCSIDLAVTVPLYRLEALMQRNLQPPALTALVLLAGAAGVGGLALGAIVAVPLLVIAALLAVSQRSALARSLAVPPDQRQARLRLAGALALIWAVALGSWVYHVNRYDTLGDTTVLVHNVVGLLSFAGAIGFGLAGLFTGRASSAA